MTTALLVVIFLVIGLVALIGSSYIFYQWEWKALFFGVPLVVVSFFINQDQVALSWIAVMVICGAVGGYSFKKEKSFSFYLIVSVFSISTVRIGTYYYALLVEKVDLSQIFFDQAKAQMPDLINKTDAENFEIFVEVLKEIAPFLIFLGSILFAVGCFFTIFLFFRWLKGSKTLRGIEFFRLNDYLI